VKVVVVPVAEGLPEARAASGVVKVEAGETAIAVMAEAAVARAAMTAAKAAAVAPATES
jgi:hypothetical protein